MKINLKNILSAMALVVMTSCVGDLNTLPLNPTDVTSESAYGKDEQSYLQGLAKLYMQIVSNDTQNLIVDDGGSSEFIRTFWSVQEISTDACKIAWEEDSWAQDLNTQKWSPEHNHMIYSVYVRTLQGVTYINEYLRQTSADKLAQRGVSAEVAKKIDGFRAEARFLRAFFYWVSLDAFGNIPFAVESTPIGGGNNPPQTERAKVFEFCVKELEELAADGSPMPEAKSNYPRADKGACLALLARMYLNAEVYTGKAMWAEAKDACERIYDLGKYSICSDYPAMFRGDNGENPEVLKEFIFAASFDDTHTRSWGGTTFLTLATVHSSDAGQSYHKLQGIKGNSAWGGARVPYEYVKKYFDVKNPDYNFDPGYACTTEELLKADHKLGYDVKDNRGRMFYIKGRKESMYGKNTEGKSNLYDFMCGWSCLKFNNTPHDMAVLGDKSEMDWETKALSTEFCNIDYPLFRLGEIHLIYAEACMHVGGSADTQLAELAARAGIAPKTQAEVTVDWLVAERARELMWEGHRRTDLIRYGLFTSGDFLWPYKGGVEKGTALEAHKTLFAIPNSERESNPALKQNVGY